MKYIVYLLGVCVFSFCFVIFYSWGFSCCICWISMSMSLVDMFCGYWCLLWSWLFYDLWGSMQYTRTWVCFYFVSKDHDLVSKRYHQPVSRCVKFHGGHVSNWSMSTIWSKKQQRGSEPNFFTTIQSMEWNNSWTCLYWILGQQGCVNSKSWCWEDVNTVDFGRCGHVCDLRQSIDQ